MQGVAVGEEEKLLYMGELNFLACEHHSTKKNQLKMAKTYVTRGMFLVT